MQLFIKVQNNGQVDEKAFRLLGASTKRGDDSKIGFFGSGNKYSIALLLRKGIYFKVFSGTSEIVFGKKTVDFGGRQYDVITVNGMETSLTTDMGPDWETWFAIREFYCNAVDEGGARIEVTDKVEPEEGKTTIYIEKVDELSSFFSNIDKYILATDRGLVDTASTIYGKVKALAGGDDEFICYRKGIRVNEASNCRSLYRYNFDSIEINESRTAKYSFQVGERIASFFARNTNREIILNYLHNWEGRAEETINWEYADEFSDTWREILTSKRVYPKSIAMISGDFEAKHNSFIVPDELAKKIVKELPDVGVVGMSQNEKYQELEPTANELERIHRTLDALGRVGYAITCKIVVASFYQDDVVASYDDVKKQIAVARRHMDQDQAEFESTLLEEFFHSIGQVDGQRSFVTFLIKELIKAKKQVQLSS